LKEIPRAFVESILSKTAKDMRTQIAERAKSLRKKISFEDGINENT
jgi:hypothetical protein